MRLINVLRFLAVALQIGKCVINAHTKHNLYAYPSCQLGHWLTRLRGLFVNSSSTIRELVVNSAVASLSVLRNRTTLSPQNHSKKSQPGITLLAYSWLRLFQNESSFLSTYSCLILYCSSSLRSTITWIHICVRISHWNSTKLIILIYTYIFSYL